MEKEIVGGSRVPQIRDVMTEIPLYRSTSDCVNGVPSGIPLDAKHGCQSGRDPFRGGSLVSKWQPSGHGCEQTFNATRIILP